MLEDSGADKDLIEAVEDVRHQNVTNTLAKMRVAKGLTQKQMADLIGCTQGRISKLETGRDEDLRLKDILDYARATETGLQLGIGPQPNHVQAVKYHVFALKRHLDELVNQAKGDDDDLTDAIKDFLEEEVVFNVALRLGQCLKSLPKSEPADAPEIEVISSGDANPVQEFSKNIKRLLHT